MEVEKVTEITVSYSEIVKWQACQRQHYYNFDLGLIPLEMSDPMSTGVKGHKLLQSFYEGLREGKTKEEAQDATRDQAKKLINADRFTDYPLLTAWTLVDNYIRETEFTAEATLVENRFLVPASFFSDDPIFTNVQIGFTPDVVFQRKGGWLDVEDAKFVGRAWGEKKLNRFAQLKLYQIFLEKMGYSISRCVIRFFNTKTGKITDFPYTQTRAEKSTLIHDFMGGVREVVINKSKSAEQRSLAIRTMNYTVCDFCSYNFVCGLEAEGKDATKTFDSMFKRSDYDYTR